MTKDTTPSELAHDKPSVRTTSQQRWYETTVDAFRITGVEIEYEVWANLVNSFSEDNKHHADYSPQDAEDEATAYLTLLKEKWQVTEVSK